MNENRSTWKERQMRWIGHAGERAGTGLIVMALTLATTLWGCSDDPVSDEFGAIDACSIDRAAIFDGGPGKDGIPALTDPDMVAADDPAVSYLLPNDRVIGLEIDGQAFAVPLNIGWWHEIVNLDVGGRRLAVTHCPLTGSSLVFDRDAVGGAEFGVSGLLFMNNLIMYDRTTRESLWPQMARGARCGPRDGAGLTMVPAIEVRWSAWRALHPATRVVSGSTGFPRNYRAYPYGDYDRVDNPALLFPVPRTNSLRPPKERVLGIPAGDGFAFPFGVLDAEPVNAVRATAAGGDVVVFWDRAAQAAMAYRPVVDGTALSFEVVDGAIIDDQTGSEWRFDGLAVDGPLAGRRLEPVDEAYVAFWFAWSNFHPDTRVFTGVDAT